MKFEQTVMLYASARCSISELNSARSPLTVAAQICSDVGLLRTSESLLGHAYTLEILENHRTEALAVLDTMVSHANVMVKIGKIPQAHEVLRAVLQQRYAF
jgi:hypothetical protein